MSQSIETNVIECTECPALECSVFSSCPLELLDAVSAVRESVEVAKDQVLYKEGSPVGGVYCQRSGRFALLRHSGGEEHVIGISRPGYGLGAKDLLQGGVHEHTAIALEAATLCFVPAGLFRSLVRDHPSIIVRVMEGVCRKLSEIERQIERHEQLSGK